jgi:hypothetical protein
MFFPHLGGMVFHHFHLESDEKKDNPINPVDPVQILFIS